MVIFHSYVSLPEGSHFTNSHISMTRIDSSFRFDLQNALKNTFEVQVVFVFNRSDSLMTNSWNIIQVRVAGFHVRVNIDMGLRVKTGYPNQVIP